MAPTNVEDRVRELGEPLVAPHGLTLLDVECKRGPKRMLVRLTIDHIEGTDGVTIEECTLVSRLVGTVLEVEDVIPISYTLEVSSPGVERALKTPSDFRRFAGRRAKVVLERVAEGAPRPAVDAVSGIIADADEEGLTLDTEKGESVRVRYEDVKRANLEFRFEDHR